MPKQLKKIKVKKPKKPRQPRRAGVPRKPPVTNISVNISGGSNQPSGSYYFPDAQQQVQPLVSNIFTPTQPEQFRPRVLEEPVRDVVEMATQTTAPRLVINTEPQAIARAAGGGRPFGTGTSIFSIFEGGRTRSMNAEEVRNLATGLGIPTTNIATGKKIKIPVLRDEIKKIKEKSL
jgi:hypothetical protein